MAICSGRPSANSNAEAANKNGTYQSADQTQTGNSCKCQGGLQAIGQFADNDQKAGALAATVQVKPSNENIGVRVLSPGNDGPVSQTNEATSNAEAGNLNATKQDATQAQSGSGLQVIGQAAKNERPAGHRAGVGRPPHPRVGGRMVHRRPADRREARDPDRGAAG